MGSPPLDESRGGSHFRSVIGNSSFAHLVVPVFPIALLCFHLHTACRVSCLLPVISRSHQIMKRAAISPAAFTPISTVFLLNHLWSRWPFFFLVQWRNWRHGYNCNVWWRQVNSDLFDVIHQCNYLHGHRNPWLFPSVARIGLNRQKISDSGDILLVYWCLLII